MMSDEGVDDLQQTQPEISIDIEKSHEKESLTPSMLGDRDADKASQGSANEVQDWNEYLWEMIRTGTPEEMLFFLSVFGGTKTINGINNPSWENGPPMLHVVIRKRFEIHVLLMLVKFIPNDELILQDDTGETALHAAIHAGNSSFAMVLIEREPKLVIMRNNYGRLPVELAAGKSQKELSFHLHQLTKLEKQYQSNEESDLLLKAISSGWFEMVLYILSGDPELEWHKMEPLLTYFVNEPRAFQSRSPSNILQSFIYCYINVNPEEMSSFLGKEMLESEKVDFYGGRMSITKVLKGFLEVPKKIWDKLVKPIEDVRRAKMEHCLTSRTLRNVCREMSALHLTDQMYRLRGMSKSDFDASSIKSVFFLAAQYGIHEMVELILDEFPEAIDSRNDKGHSVLDLAAMYRHEKVFMIALSKGQHMKGEMKLFLVAENALQSLLDSGSRVVFQMQRELQWFKEMEKLMPEQRNFKNSEGKTPIEVFKEKHQDLIDYENKWMLEMANSCIIGGSLIATVVFAASITVPGGNNSSSGLPIFLNVSPYQVFTIANGLSLTFSLTCVLIFLSIFTARYSVNDYLYSLPSRIIFGLIFLFLAVTLLMVDFTAIAFLVSGPENRKNVYIVAASACIPVGFFAYLQAPSLVNMIRSTFGNHALKENNNQRTRRLGRSELLLR